MFIRRNECGGTRRKRSLLGVNLLGGHHRWLISRLYAVVVVAVVMLLQVSTTKRESEAIWGGEEAIDHSCGPSEEYNTNDKSRERWILLRG